MVRHGASEAAEVEHTREEHDDKAAAHDGHLDRVRERDGRHAAHELADEHEAATARQTRQRASHRVS